MKREYIVIYTADPNFEDSGNRPKWVVFHDQNGEIEWHKTEAESIAFDVLSSYKTIIYKIA